jgi:hypothetical protein
MTTNKSNALMENDVVVRYSQSNNIVSILAVNHRLNEPHLRVMHEFPWNPADGVIGITDIGAGVGAFLHASFRDAFCSTEQWKKLAEQIRIAAGRDDEPTSPDELEPLTKFAEADALIAQLGDHSDLADLDAITVLLEQANAEGDTVAGQYLEVRWPPLKDVFARRIMREKRLRGESS